MTETVTLARHSPDDRLPPLGLPVIAETADGFLYAAMRYESQAQQNSYFWGLHLKGKPIGVIVDVAAWFEIYRGEI